MRSILLYCQQIERAESRSSQLTTTTKNTNSHNENLFEKPVTRILSLKDDVSEAILSSINKIKSTMNNTQLEPRFHHLL